MSVENNSDEEEGRASEKLLMVSLLQSQPLAEEMKQRRSIIYHQVLTEYQLTLFLLLPQEHRDKYQKLQEFTWEKLLPEAILRLIVK